jgi:hypothetical protein
MDDPEVSKYFNSFDCAVAGSSAPSSEAPAESEAATESEAPAG